MGINNKNLSVIFFLFLSMNFSCSSGIKQAERWEGLKKGKLRVYVRDSMDDIEEDKDFEKNARKKLIQMANQRATHLLISYIRANLKERSRYDSYNNDILAIIGKASLKFDDCNKDYCEAFTDYDTVKLIEKIDTAEKKENAPIKKSPASQVKEEKEKSLER
jgi:hypothetical protein